MWLANNPVIHNSLSNPPFYPQSPFREALSTTGLYRSYGWRWNMHILNTSSDTFHHLLGRVTMCPKNDALCSGLRGHLVHKFISGAGRFHDAEGTCLANWNIEGEREGERARKSSLVRFRNFGSPKNYSRGRAVRQIKSFFPGDKKCGMLKWISFMAFLSA